jgi:hypothetical protein
MQPLSLLFEKGKAWLKGSKAKANGAVKIQELRLSEEPLEIQCRLFNMTPPKIDFRSHLVAALHFDAASPCFPIYRSEGLVPV